MKLYVGRLPYATTEQDLEDLFGQFGEVTTVNVIMDRETGRSKGFGFVEMSDDDAARAAMSALHDSTLQGRTIVVNEANERPPRSGGSSGGGNRGGFQNRERRSYDRGDRRY